MLNHLFLSLIEIILTSVNANMPKYNVLTALPSCFLVYSLLMRFAEISIIYLISAWKHRLWAHMRFPSWRQHKWVLTVYIFDIVSYFCQKRVLGYSLEQPQWRFLLSTLRQCLWRYKKQISNINYRHSLELPPWGGSNQHPSSTL